MAFVVVIDVHCFAAAVVVAFAEDNVAAAIVGDSFVAVVAGVHGFVDFASAVVAVDPVVGIATSVQLGNVVVMLGVVDVPPLEPL